MAVIAIDINWVWEPTTIARISFNCFFSQSLPPLGFDFYFSLFTFVTFFERLQLMSTRKITPGNFMLRTIETPNN